MRIDELKLMAFGPFTDTCLDLTKGEEGLHIIFGTNEAGKSSALRAIRQLLHGIPDRSKDNFIHPYQNMRIGATIRSRSGVMLSFIRRKGRGNTLRMENDEEILNDSELGTFISGVNASLFETMFGIGHEDLICGGKDIIKGGGDLGRLIFSAGSGIVNLREIQGELKDEIDQLFKPSGQKPKINDTLGRINRIRKQMRENQLPSKEWAVHDEILKGALAEKKLVDQDLSGKQKILSRLQRIQKALPIIAKRRELIHKVADHVSTILLPEGFSERRRKCISRLDIAKQERLQSENNVVSIEKSIGGLDISFDFIKNAEMIEKLFRELGSQNKAFKDRVALDTRRSALRGEAKDILLNLKKGMTLEDAEQLRIEKNQTVRIRELGAQYERIIARIEDAKEKLPNLSQEIDRIQTTLQRIKKPLGVDDLKISVSEAETYRSFEKHLQTEQVEINTTLKQILSVQKRLGLKLRSFEEIEQLEVPGIETIRLFENQMDQANRQLADVKNEIKKTRRKLMDVQHKIDIQKLEQDVPTEAELLKIRHLRDQGWDILHSQLKGEQVFAGERVQYLKKDSKYKTVESLFESYMKKADRISDRLRREADRVADNARLLADKMAFEYQLGNLEQELEEVGKERDSCHLNWAELWAKVGLKALTPREMGQWFQDFKILLEKIQNSQSRKEKAGGVEKEISHQKTKLITCMSGLGVSLKDQSDTSLVFLLKRAQSLIKQEEEKDRACKQLERDKILMEKEYFSIQTRLVRMENDLKAWQKDWEEAVKPIGLNRASLPAQANVVMDTLKNLFDKLKEAKILEKRIAGIDRDAKNFEDRVHSLYDIIAKDLKGRSVHEGVMDLNHRLKLKRDAHSKKETLEKQLSQEKKRLAQSSQSIIKIESELDNMCKEAGCKDVDGLIETERLSHQKHQLDKELSLTETSLRQLSGGITVNEFVSETHDVDSDSITLEVEGLESELSELNKKRSELDQTIGSEKTLLRKMDGGAKAADLAEKIEILLGRLDNDVEQYAKIKIAMKILSMVIERYRDKNQGPILKRASCFFKDITHHAFKGIRAEYDDKGDPVVTGLKGNGKEVIPVNGMSEGTADQLYLSLRLAGLIEYLEKNEPIPFIVDDILLKFDNERSVATLKALLELSKKTQVIFFTHHHHLVELAKKYLPEDAQFHHRLSAVS